MKFILLAMLAVSAAAGTTPEGKKWLADNKGKDGVIELASGLQYKVIKDGEAGAKSPLVGTPCKCHYRGTLVDGTEFDSSYKRGAPATFAPNQVVKGWTEAMQLPVARERIRRVCVCVWPESGVAVFLARFSRASLFCV